MPRQARLDISGLVYHVMARGIEGRDIFLSDKERDEFLKHLAELAGERGGPALYAWALMSNHFHLLLRPREIHLPTFMQRLTTSHAVNFNKRHNRTGHLFQNRYKSIVIEKDSYFMELVRYINLNPVRYAAHSVVTGKTQFPVQDVDGVLSWFSCKRGEALARYRAFVDEGFDQGVREDLRGGGLIRSAGGMIAVLARGSEANDSADERILGSGEFVEFVLEAACAARPSAIIDEILQDVSGSSGISAKAIVGQSRSRVVCQARTEFYRRAREEAGASVTELGCMTGRSHVAVLRALARIADGNDVVTHD